jgi:photosystem II stability/assembly factor-like uncharacterized protein
MSDPDDRIDAWLNAEVEPLAPPPGTFERIRHRAHRRKVRRATMSAAGAAIVIAAAAVAPGIASTLLHSGSSRPERPVAVGTSAPASRPAVTSSGSGGVESQSSRPVPPPGSALSATTSGAPVPANFQPTSVTFIGAIGAVIGQAGTPGHCATRYCTSLAGTSDYGTSWYGVSAPVTGPPDGGQGVGQLRFLDLRHGWAFGPQLWVTNDGGAHWTRQPTHGMRVTDLETAGDRAFALFARCTGSGADFAAHCSSFSLETSLAGTDQWQPVPGPAGSGLRLPPAAAGQAASASLVLTGGPSGGQGYLLAPSGELLSGPLAGGAWTVASAALPCSPGAPGPSGQPGGALLAADSNLLVLVCTSATNAASDTQAKAIEVSSDGGAHWSRAGTGLPGGIAVSAAIQAQDNLMLLATDAGLYRSADGGSAWRLAHASPAGAAAGETGFSYVGMTSPTNGVALPADPGLHKVFVTTDGGSSWLPQAVSGP